MQALEEQDFDSRVMDASVPALVVFTADWCAPCQWLKPYLEEIASMAGSRALVFSVDADRSPRLSERYEVASLPTVILIEAGREVDRSLGIEPDRLRSWVASLTCPEGGTSGGPDPKDTPR